MKVPLEPLLVRSRIRVFKTSTFKSLVFVENVEALRHVASIFSTIFDISLIKMSEKSREKSLKTGALAQIKL